MPRSTLDVADSTEKTGSDGNRVGRTSDDNGRAPHRRGVCRRDHAPVDIAALRRAGVGSSARQWLRERSACATQE